MSGPIVRKYGFPNFENIFGKRNLEHGIDEPEASGPGGDLESDRGTGLPPDLGDTSGKPVDAPEIQPATEFGNAVE